MLTIASYFWVDPARRRSYTVTPEHVRIWRDMVERHVKVPHKTVCITHRPDLIDFMETVPIDPTKHVPGTCLVKLMHWKPDIEKVLGKRICVMDVDCIMRGSFDHVFERTEDVVLWKNPNYEKDGRRGFYQGSMQLFTAGAKPELWEDFDPKNSMAQVNRRFGGAEQAWISERLNTSWPDEGWEWDTPHWTEEDNVYGFGRMFLGKMGKGVTDAPPENGIIFTPGDRTPDMLQEEYQWIKETYY